MSGSALPLVLTGSHFNFGDGSPLHGLKGMLTIAKMLLENDKKCFGPQRYDWSDIGDACMVV